MAYERDVLLERRQQSIEEAGLWDKLSLPQKFASSSLTHCGYELSYIRQSNAGNLAILLRDDNSATVDKEGDINTNPNITIRA